MNRKSIVLITILLVVTSLLVIHVGAVVFDSDFDGINNNVDLFPYNSDEWADFDKDGYGDNSDDFPQDSKIHKKCQVACVKNYRLTSGETYYPPDCGCFEIGCHCRYLIIDWYISELDSSEIQKISINEDSIFIQINYPSLCIRRDYQFFNTEKIAHSFKCRINPLYDVGECSIYFYNDLQNDDVIMNCDIYRAI